MPNCSWACARRFIRQQVPVRPPQLWKRRHLAQPKNQACLCGLWLSPASDGISDCRTQSRSTTDHASRSWVSLSARTIGAKIRARLVRAFDQFHDVRTKGDREVAALLNELQVDIAI